MDNCKNLAYKEAYEDGYADGLSVNINIIKPKQERMITEQTTKQQVLVKHII